MAFISPSGQRFVQTYRITRYLVTELFVYQLFWPNLPVLTKYRRRLFYRICESGGISFLEIIRLDIDVSQTSFLETWP